MAELHDPLLGTTFAGRYRIERRLGEGGMGCVYLATQLSMDRQVALKVLGEHMVQSEAAAKRFHREMQATARVEHQNTIRVYDFGETDDGQLFLAMELLDGRTLHSVLHTEGAFETGRALHVAAQIARALGAAHHEGIVHRDLKPENIMLLDRYGERDFVKVLDFGIARFAQGAEPADGEPQITKAGTLIGTPLYMSPEQALGRELDGRSDLYSLGILLFQMVTGGLPFTAPLPVRLLYMHAHEPPPRPTAVAPGRVPAAVEGVILRLLAKDPADRPQDAAQLVQDLRECTEHATLIEPGGASPESKLSDPAARAAARKHHADPQSRIPTRRGSVTVDPDADDTAPTTDNLAPLQAIVTAPTMQALPADVAMTSTPTAQVTVQADEGADTGAATMVQEPEPQTTVLPASEPPTTALPASEPAAVAQLAPNVDVPAPEPGPDVAPESAADARPADDVVPSAPPRSKGPLIIAAVAMLAMVAGALMFVRSGDPKSAKIPDSKADSAAPAAALTAAQTGAPAADPRVTVLRSKIDATAKAAGEPTTPASCRATDLPTLTALAAAAGQLVDGKTRGKRPQDRAAAAALAGLKSDQPEVQALLARARLLSALSDTETVQAADAAIKACPDAAAAHAVLGTVHRLSGRYKVAAQAYKRALHTAPKYNAARFGLAIAQLGDKQAQDSIASFDKLIAADHEFPDAHFGRAQARFGARDFKGALVDLEVAAKQTPDKADVWFLLANAHLTLDHADEANTAFCKASALGKRGADEMCKK